MSKLPLRTLEIVDYLVFGIGKLLSRENGKFATINIW
jgi:hypothetical protein